MISNLKKEVEGRKLPFVPFLQDMSLQISVDRL